MVGEDPAEARVGQQGGPVGGGYRRGIRTDLEIELVTTAHRADLPARVRHAGPHAATGARNLPRTVVQRIAPPAGSVERAGIGGRRSVVAVTDRTAVAGYRPERLWRPDVRVGRWRGQATACAASRSPTSAVRSGAPGVAAGQLGATASVTRAAASAWPRWSSSSAAESTAATGSATPLPAMSGAEPCTGSNIDGYVPLGVDAAAGRQPDAAGDGGGDVGEDVAEEVVGDHHVVALRLGHQEHRGGVDVLVLRGDVGVLGGDRGEGAGPEPAGVGEHVGLVHQGDLAPLAAPRPGRTRRG